MGRYDSYDDYDGYYEEPSCEGVSEGCGGCESCIKEVRHAQVRVARKARKGILVGDLVRVVSGYDYQVGGKRLGYTHSEYVIGLGPNRSPVMVGMWWDRPSFALPEEAKKRESLRASWALLSRDVSSGWGIGVGASTELLGKVLLLEKEISEFCSLYPSQEKTLLDYIRNQYPWQSDVLKRAQDLVKSEGAREEQTRLKGAWDATGARLRRGAGEKVMWEGREYIMGAEWTRWVAHSNLEYMGESVDGEVVWGRDLIDPETNKVAFKWRSGWDYPRAV